MRILPYIFILVLFIAIPSCTKKGQREKEPKLIKWIDDNRKSSPERFPNLLTTPGKYFIEILQSDRDAKKVNKETLYELVLKSREPISEESEPNDSKDEANKIYPSKEITGYFS